MNDAAAEMSFIIGEADDMTALLLLAALIGRGHDGAIGRSAGDDGDDAACRAAAYFGAIRRHARASPAIFRRHAAPFARVAIRSTPSPRMNTAAHKAE